MKTQIIVETSTGPQARWSLKYDLQWVDHASVLLDDRDSGSEDVFLLAKMVSTTVTVYELDLRLLASTAFESSSLE